jgi:hypothetical protein
MSTWYIKLLSLFKESEEKCTIAVIMSDTTRATRSKQKEAQPGKPGKPGNAMKKTGGKPEMKKTTRVVNPMESANRYMKQLEVKAKKGDEAAKKRAAELQGALEELAQAPGSTKLEDYLEANDPDVVMEEIDEDEPQEDSTKIKSEPSTASKVLETIKNSVQDGAASAGKSTGSLFRDDDAAMAQPTTERTDHVFVPEKKDEFPKPIDAPFDSSDLQDSGIPMTTVGWMLVGVVYKFINLYGFRSHGTYRIQTFSQPDYKFPEEENILETQVGDLRIGGRNFGPMEYGRKEWGGLVAVAWESDTVSPEDLDDLVKVDGHRRCACRGLVKWRKNDVELLTWETRAHITNRRRKADGIILACGQKQEKMFKIWMDQMGLGKNVGYDRLPTTFRTPSVFRTPSPSAEEPRKVRRQGSLAATATESAGISKQMQALEEQMRQFQATILKQQEQFLDRFKDLSINNVPRPVQVQ